MDKDHQVERMLLISFEDSQELSKIIIIYLETS